MNTTPTISPILALTMPRFKAAAAEGCVLELRMRLLAGCTPAIKHYETAKNLSEVEDQIVKEFAKELSAKEVDDFAACRHLRNKILHCDFAAARGVLHREVRVSPLPAGVTRIELASGSTSSVADTASTAEGTVIGWLLESANDFVVAVEIFQRCGAVVERLAELRSRPVPNVI